MSDSSIAFVALVTVAIVTTNAQINNKTPHWQRCSAILKSNGRHSQNCTGYQMQDCRARKLVSGQHAQLCSHDDDCPPPISDLHVALYKEFADADDNSDKYYKYGANVSWTVNRTGTEADYQPKKFEAIVEVLDNGGKFRAEITVNLTEQDYVDGKATIHYDCFYLLKTNKSMTAIVRTMPYRENVFLQQLFTTVDSALHTPDTLTSFTMTTTTESTTSEPSRPRPTSQRTTPLIIASSDDHASQDIDSSPKQANIPEITTDITTDRFAEVTKEEQTSKTAPALMYGLTGGLAAILALILCGVFIKKIVRKKNEGSSSRAPNDKDSESQIKREDHLKAVALVYAKDEEYHTAKCVGLANSLSDCAEVKDIWYTKPENIYACLESATTIVIVVSPSVRQIFKNLDETSGKVPDLITVTLEVLKQSYQLQDKIVTVTYETNISEVSFSLGPSSLVLPGEQPELMKLLKTESHVPKSKPKPAKVMLTKQTSYSEHCSSEDSGYIQSPVIPNIEPSVNPFLPIVQTLPCNAISSREVQYIPYNNAYQNPAYCHGHCPAHMPPYSSPMYQHCVHGHGVGPHVSEPEMCQCNANCFPSEPDMLSDVSCGLPPEPEIRSGMPNGTHVATWSGRPIVPVYPRRPITDMESDILSSAVGDINQDSDICSWIMNSPDNRLRLSQDLSNFDVIADDENDTTNL